MTDDEPSAFENDLDEERGGLSDSIRRAVVSGLSALVMTEEGIRGALSEMRLPKDAMSYLTQQAERSRKELFRAVSEELKRFLIGIDVTQAVKKALTGMKVEVKAEVRFIDEGRVEGSVKTTATPVTGPSDSAVPGGPQRPRGKRSPAASK